MVKVIFGFALCVKEEKYKRRLIDFALVCQNDKDRINKAVRSRIPSLIAVEILLCRTHHNGEAKRLKRIAGIATKN
jgi:hypothetical protein